MKYLLTTFTTLIAVGMFMTASPVLAQTPDGETPANEGVCDELKADGVTKGLYGLCVAFCEAQDHADEYVEISEDALEALLADRPSGRILANYNKKKDRANNPADPDMPCVKVEEPCPCWTSEEFDLVMTQPYSVDNCHRWNGTWHNGSYVQSYQFDDTVQNFLRVLALDHQHNIPGGYGNLASCQFYDYTWTHGEGYSPGSIIRRLPITPDELTACDAQIRAAQEEFMMSCGDSN